MSKRVIGLALLTLVISLCVIVVSVGMWWARPTSSIAPASTAIVAKIVATPAPSPTETRPVVPTNTARPATAGPAPTITPAATAIPQRTNVPTNSPSPTALPATAPPAANRAPQTLTLSAAQASNMIAERIGAAKMPLSNIQVVFNDNQTIVLDGTAQVRLPIVGNVSGPLKVLLVPVVRQDKLEADVNSIQFNGLDITQSYKTNVEAGVNQAFANALGNRRVQQATIVNQQLVVTLLP